MAKFTYLPWFRQGLIGAAAAGSAAVGKDSRIQLSVTVDISVDISGGDGVTTRPVDILLFGPGDVTGFDARQVIRTDPPPLTTDFEPNYFPTIEFDRPDFPWLFTPMAPDANQRIQPWICLIVVEKREGVSLSFTEGQPLPVLEIKDNAHRELPDLEEAWAWAHTEIGTPSEDIGTALEKSPELTKSTLLCPRRLKPKTSYYACVVPVFSVGVKAGLGEQATAGNPQGNLMPLLAWKLSQTAPDNVRLPDNIRLPVYFHWEFGTGAQGDFESLVWQLIRRQLTLEDVGTRKLDISRAGYDLVASSTVDLEGALMPQITAQYQVPVGPYASRLQALLNRTAAGDIPVLAPPLYGRWHAAQRSIPDVISPTNKRNRLWLMEINLDPRYRVAAGLGAQVVQEKQEQLMAAAWDQVSGIEKANQVIRQAQLARAASAILYLKTLDGLDPETFLLVTAPLQARVTYQSAGREMTVRGHVLASALPLASTSFQFRRLTRQRGPVARRFGMSYPAAQRQMVSQLNLHQILPAPRNWPFPDGMATMEQLLKRSLCNPASDQLAQGLLNAWPAETLILQIKNVLVIFQNRLAEIDSLAAANRDLLRQSGRNLEAAQNFLEYYVQKAPARVNIDVILAYYQPGLSRIAEASRAIERVVRNLRSQPRLPSVVNALNQAVMALPSGDGMRDMLFGLAALVHLRQVEPCDSSPKALNPTLDLKELKKKVYQKLDPRQTISRRVGAVITAPGWKADDLDFILAAPDFPEPMYTALVGFSQDWLLPGLERVPQNTLAIINNNPRFIEAYMVGLNHEMSRELLWRGFTTDQRGTYFRQFWDPRGRFPAPKDEAETQANLENGKDIPKLHEWGDAALGSSFGNKGSSSTTTSPTTIDQKPILLIRGDLLRRYPRASIFMVKAKLDGTIRNPVDITDEKDTNQVRYPIFHGELPPDITFLGFDLDTAEARGDRSLGLPGWFLVIQQQPTEPRYGLDEVDKTVTITDPMNLTWRDLAWPNVFLSEENGYIQISQGLQGNFPKNGNKLPGDWKWSTQTGADGSDSAQIASITLQGPVRVFIHASDLI